MTNKDKYIACEMVKSICYENNCDINCPFIEIDQTGSLNCIFDTLPKDWTIEDMKND